MRNAYEIPDDAPIVGIFFGSRLSELQTLSSPFAEAIERILSVRPDCYFIAPMASSIDEDILAAAGADLRLQNVILLPEHRKKDVFATADVALACSGTVTTQLASVGVPTVVAYKLSTLTYFFAKRLFKPNYISLVNIAADKNLMPEFMQGDATGAALAQAVITRLESDDLRRQERAGLLAQISSMRHKKNGSASNRAALKLLEFLRG